MRKGLLAAMLIITLVATLTPLASAKVTVEEVDKYLSSIDKDFDTIATTAVYKKIEAGEKIFILDVREPEEFAAGHIQGSINIPLRTVAKNLRRIPNDGTLIVVVCKKGVRAGYVTACLKLLGYTNVRDMSGE